MWIWWFLSWWGFLIFKIYHNGKIQINQKTMKNHNIEMLIHDVAEGGPTISVVKTI